MPPQRVCSKSPRSKGPEVHPVKSSGGKNQQEPCQEKKPGVPPPSGGMKRVESTSPLAPGPSRHHRSGSRGRRERIKETSCAVRELQLGGSLPGTLLGFWHPCRHLLHAKGPLCQPPHLKHESQDRMPLPPRNTWCTFACLYCIILLRKLKSQVRNQIAESNLYNFLFLCSFIM